MRLTNAEVHYCVICGPVMRETFNDGQLTVTWHNMLPHPEFDESSDTLAKVVDEDQRTARAS